ncbi:hypothetical protein ACEPPN_014573 [Leptodophora sp. 'Broadleaf-Isolate-01']
MASPANAVPDTQLGLTNDEIALLRHHQQAAASTAGGSSSRAASRASSQGLLLLDGTSLAALGRHFDRLMQQIQERLDYLSEQSQMVAQQQYDRAGNAIAIADSEIARFHEILRQIDELEDKTYKRYRERLPAEGRGDGAAAGTKWFKRSAQISSPWRELRKLK